MINLLPPETKSSYYYARRNIGLRKWAIAFLVGLVGLAAIANYGLFTIYGSTNSYKHQVAATTTKLQTEKLSQTEKQVQDISGSLRLAVKVLSQEVLFSKLITQIGAAMPDGADLTGLNINQTSGGIDLSADATDYTAATQVQVNLSDASNKIFAKVDILSITCSTQNVTDISHPCTIEMRALFNNDNQFLFINQGSSS